MDISKIKQASRWCSDAVQSYKIKIKKSNLDRFDFSISVKTFLLNQNVI